MCFVARGKREFEKHSKGWEDFCSGRYPLPSDSMKKVTTYHAYVAVQHRARWVDRQSLAEVDFSQVELLLFVVNHTNTIPGTKSGNDYLPLFTALRRIIVHTKPVNSQRPKKKIIWSKLGWKGDYSRARPLS